MNRSSWRLLLVLAALMLGAFAGAYVAGEGVTACVDVVNGDSYCRGEVRPSALGAVVGAVLAGSTTFVATRRWSKRG